jgi:Tfp pilus assembly protein PilN
MVIELTPKKPEKKPFIFLDFFFYFSFILLFIILLSLGGSFLLENNLKKNLKEIEEEIAKKESAEGKRDEAKVLLIQKQINDFIFLLNSRYSNSRFFDSFQKIVHPKVYFDRIDLKIENGIASLSGLTESPLTLSQQLFAFRRSGYFKKIDLKRISISNEGKYQFEIDLFFEPVKFQ